MFGKAQQVPQSEKRHSGRGVLPVWPRFFLIGPLLTTVKAMALPAMAFCLITKSPRRGETFVTRKISRAVAAD